MINKKISTLLLSLAIPTLFQLGCDGDESDPATAGKDELNPPGDISTVTKDKAIELRWTAANVEEDFQGYYVFGIKKSDYDAKAKGKAAYPKGKANPEVSGIPRCAENSAFFEAFGLPKSEADCEGAEESTESTGAKLTQDAEKAATEKLTGFLTCGDTKTTPSLVAKAPIVKTQKCLVSALADGTKLANGTEYAFFVVAVAGDEFNSISWTSKVIFDAPSADALDAANKTLTFNANSGTNGSYYKITLNPAAGTTTVTSSTDCSSTGDLCGTISNKNAQSATTPDIYISRAAANDYRQRLYISAPAGGVVKIRPRGPQTFDPLTGAITTDGRIPGDKPATSYPKNAAGESKEPGTKYVVYNNQIFDFEVTSGGKIYYGKVFIGDVTYSGGGTDSKYGDLIASVKINVVLQPGAGLPYYGLERPEL